VRNKKGFNLITFFFGFVEVVSLFYVIGEGYVRSPIVTYTYEVESEARPGSYGYLSPYWNGLFAKVALEASGANRAQLSEIQVFHLS